MRRVEHLNIEEKDASGPPNMRETIITPKRIWPI
jgi:hypothetical protein